MKEVKTYENVDRNHKELSFGISRMEDIYRKHNKTPDAPHRHNYYTVIFTIKAKGKHIVDFNEYPLLADQVYFISPGQVHQVIEDEESVGFSMVFSNEFLLEHSISNEFIANLNLFQNFGECPPLELGKEELQKAKFFLDEIHQEFIQDQPFKYRAIGAWLELFLILCNNGCNLERPKEILNSKQATLYAFKNLIDQKYRDWHASADYASELNLSSDYLNRIVKSQTGKTSKVHIQSRIILAAKRMLFFTELSNKEIGFELGFSEATNFSAFFKKCVGIAASEFRNLHR